MSETHNLLNDETRNFLTEFEEFCIGHWPLYLKFHRVLRENGDTITKKCQKIMEICRLSWELPVEVRKAPSTLRCQAAQKLCDYTDRIIKLQDIQERKIKILEEKIQHKNFQYELRRTLQDATIFKLEKKIEGLEKELKKCREMNPEKRRRIEEL